LNVRLTYTPSEYFDSEYSVGMFSIISLGAIPVWGTRHYEVKALVKNKRGLEKEYTVKDSVTAAIWLPLIVFTPFTYDGGENVRRNMYRNIINQMYEDGFMGES